MMNSLRNTRALSAQLNEINWDRVKWNVLYTVYSLGLRVKALYLFLLCQAQPNADVLAVQPQDAADVPRDHWDAAGGPAPVFPGGLLLLQRGEQSPRDGGVRPGPGQHGEHPPGPVVVLPERGELRQGQRALSGPQGELWGACPLHTHERWQEKRTNLIVAQIQPFLTFPVSLKNLFNLSPFPLPILFSLPVHFFFCILHVPHHFLMIFLFLEKPFKKKHPTDLRTFYFLPHGCQTQASKGCKHRVTLFFFTSSTTHRTFYYRITYLLFFTIAMFPGLLVMETEKKLWTQQTLDNQEGCLCSTSSRLAPPLLPTNLHFHISVLCFSSKWNLVTQIVAFLYVAYKQREVSISAYTNFLLNNDLISLERWDDLQRLDPRTNIYS